MPTWSREAQDTAEAEHPPPTEPQDDPKVRSWPVWSLGLIIVAAAMLFVALVALGDNTFISI